MFGGIIGRCLEGIWRCVQEVFRGNISHEKLMQSIPNPYTFRITALFFLFLSRDDFVALY